jgi:hypothetical protein
MVVRYIVNRPPYHVGQERNVPDFMAVELVKNGIAKHVDKIKADKIETRSMHQSKIRNK